MSGPDTEEYINQVYSNQHFQAIGLDYWQGSTITTVGGFQQSTQITYPLCINATATRTAYSAYEGLDISMIIDQDGIVRYRGGGVNLTEILSVIDNLIVTSNIEEKIRPHNAFLYQNYPNPFNPSTVISFKINSIQKVSLKIYNNQGRLVRSLLENTMHAGNHAVSWDGKNVSAEQVSAGVYYYVLQSADFKITKKMTLIR